MLNLCSFWSTGLSLNVGLCLQNVVLHRWWRTLLLLGGRPCTQHGHWVADLIKHLLGEGDDMLKEGDDMLLGEGKRLNKRAGKLRNFIGRDLS